MAVHKAHLASTDPRCPAMTLRRQRLRFRRREQPPFAAFPRVRPMRPARTKLRVHQRKRAVLNWPPSEDECSSAALMREELPCRLLSRACTRGRTSFPAGKGRKDGSGVRGLWRGEEGCRGGDGSSAPAGGLRGPAASVCRLRGPRRLPPRIVCCVSGDERPAHMTDEIFFALVAGVMFVPAPLVRV